MKKSNLNFQTLLKAYQNIYFIVSPPRCSSTAFSRVFWEHPSIRYYSHEPFETTYYENKPLADVYKKLASPLDLHPIKENESNTKATSLVIKEMPYQVGDNFSLAVKWVNKPIIFLIRDPRLNIQSRIDKKLETGHSFMFPLVETGWTLIDKQIAYTKKHNIPYIIIDATTFRNNPTTTFKQIFSYFGLTFSSQQLSWKGDENIQLDNLGGAHSHLYRKVLRSNSILPADEVIPSLKTFPVEHGIREHVKESLDIYHKLSQDKYLIT